MSTPILIATRGSALALAQANNVLAQCRAAMPEQAFALNIIKTTGDKLQTASMAKPDASLPKGLFTKELEVALLQNEADLAVHSLKDLPTELPAGLKLGAVGPRADVRDVLLYRAAGAAASRRGFAPHIGLQDFPPGAVIATSSTRRRAQLLTARPDLQVVEIRGNVATRLQKLAERTEMDATVLALAGLSRLHFAITPDGQLTGESVPEGVLAVVLDTELMLPCVGQGAVGIEIRERDERMEALCARLNHADTFYGVSAERAFLHALGGGCQSPVAAYAEIAGGTVRMRAISFRDGPARRTAGVAPVAEAVALGVRLAGVLASPLAAG
jgi:hydroxymethylbilane synthase